MNANIRGKLMHIMDIILRVPPVFVMDGILNKGYSYEYTYRLKPISQDESPKDQAESSQKSVSIPTNGDPQELGVSVDYVFVSSISFDLQTVLLFTINVSGFLMAFIIFLLSRDHLVATYKWLFSVGAVFLSYWSNVTYLSHTADDSTSLLDRVATFWTHFILQLLLALAFSLTHSHRGVFGVLGLATFILPPMASTVTLLPNYYMKTLPIVSALLSLTFIKMCLILRLKAVYLVVRNGIRRSQMIVRYYGIHTLLENEWLRLNVPHVLRVFWLTRVMEHMVYMVAGRLEPEGEVQQMIATSLDSLSNSVKELLSQGCDTMVAVLGMTSIVASVAHYLGSAMQHFLLTEDEEEKSIGTVSAVLFFILALQTGLTGLEPEKRFVRLYRNFCLLFTAILHFIHNMVNPLLMSLSASRNRSVQRHGRALAVCSFLILFPCWFLTYLWKHHSVSTWLLAVSAFSIEVVIKVIISLMIYLLFMVDAYRNSFWEQLDDYVYYIRATGNTIEFVFGIFLFFNGTWILLFESGGAIRACMMCIHAYFNIWLQAKAGWRTFIKRRTAVNKINALPEATEEQLSRFDDVCAICYQELTNARITKCNHYFHGVCLRKWLYVQDRCPLCHDTLYKLDSDSEECPAADNSAAENNDEDDANAENEANRQQEPNTSTAQTVDNSSSATPQGHSSVESQTNTSSSGNHHTSTSSLQCRLTHAAVPHEHED